MSNIIMSANIDKIFNNNNDDNNVFLQTYYYKTNFKAVLYQCMLFINVMYKRLRICYGKFHSNRYYLLELPVLKCDINARLLLAIYLTLATINLA